MISKSKVNGQHTTFSVSNDQLFLIETDMLMEKSHFQYGKKDGEYHEFIEAVSRT